MTSAIFDFSSLIPGTYFVSVSATRGMRCMRPPRQQARVRLFGVSPALDAAYPNTYYSSATEAAGATPIVVKAREHPEIEVH